MKIVIGIKSMQSGNFILSSFFFCLFALVSFALTYKNTHASPSLSRPPMDFAYQRPVCSRNVTRPEIAFELGLANYTSTHCFTSSSRVASLILFLSFSRHYISFSRAGSHNRTDSERGRLQIAHMTRYMHARVKTKVENTIIVVMKCAASLFKIDNNKT